MNALVLTERGLVKRRVAVPEISDDEVLVKIKFASVCGSDYPVLNRHSPGFVGSVIGHEGTGFVVEKGANVSGFDIGDLVAMESHRARQSWAGDPYKDPHCAIIGFRPYPNEKITPQGTFAEYIAVPEVYAHKIPKHLVDAYPGSLWEPFGNGVRLFQTIKELKIPAEAAVVSGCGPQGIAIQAILRHYAGIDNMVATDIDEQRLAFVNEHGLAETFNPRDKDIEKKIIDSLGQKPDLWLDMCGAPAAFNLATKTTAPGGNIILFGLPKDSRGVDIAGVNQFEFVLTGRQKTRGAHNLIGVVGRHKEDWLLAPDIIHSLSKKMDLSKFYTFCGPLDNLPKMLQENEHFPPEDVNLKAVFGPFER